MSDGGLPDIGSGISDAVSSVFGSGAPDAVASGTGNVAADIGAGAVDTAAGVSPSVDAISAGAGSGLDLSNLEGLASAVPGITAGGTGVSAADIGAGGVATPPSIASSAPAAAGGGGGVSAAGNPLASAGTVPDPNSTNPVNKPSTFGTVTNFLKDNAKWLGPAAAGVTGLAKNFLTPAPTGQAELTNLAQQQQFYGNQLEAEGAAGQIPAAAQAGVTQALNQTIASIRSRYAAMGQSGSSGEQADIAAATTASQYQVYQISQQILSQGQQMLGLAGTAYNSIVNEQLAADQSFQSALQDFALAAGNSNALSKNNGTP